jgi:hypothetical protein
MLHFAFTSLLAVLSLSGSQTPPATTTPAAQTPPAAATAAAAAQSASPELVGKITDELKITPKQAEGGAGALLGLAKQRLRPEEFKQVSDAIPGTDGLLSAATTAAAAGSGSSSGASAMGAMAGMSKGAAGLASVAGTFKQLGLSPDVATKMVPVLTSFVQAKGAASAATLLTGALK